MANVNVKFNGKDFLLSCDDGQEEHLEELLIHINQKFDDLKKNLGNIGENKLLLITAVQIMDEYFETKKKVEQKIKGGSTTKDYGLPSADDKQVSGVATDMMSVDDWLVKTQPNPTVKRFVGNNEEAILKEAERVAQAKKNESFYNVFSTKWNEGSLVFQGGKKPSQKLPSRWVDYLEIKGMDESGYTHINSTYLYLFED